MDGAGWPFQCRAVAGPQSQLCADNSTCAALLQSDRFRQNSCRQGQLFFHRVAHDEAIMMRAMRLP